MDGQVRGLTTLSRTDLRTGDVILSSRGLPDVLNLIQLTGYLNLENQLWATADKLVSLISFLEAYVTQERVIFPINATADLAAIARDSDCLAFNLLLCTSDDYRQSLAAADAVDRVRLFALEAYLNAWDAAKEELDTYNAFFHKAKWIFPNANGEFKEVDKTGFVINTQAWETLSNRRTLELVAESSTPANPLS